MGIYIPNMEMPQRCKACRFCGFGGRRSELNVCMFTGESQPKLSQERMSKCPLVPLPEGHGNLIEQKALNLFPDYKEVRNGIKRTIKEAERDGRVITGVSIDLLKQTLVALDSMRSVRRYFLNAKTIVPAEGGTDDGN